MNKAEQMVEEERRESQEQHERQIRETLAAIEHRIVVFSGKGGVGKTTVAVNLAYALSKIGKRVGLLDADITGPNVSKMVGTSGPFREWEGQIVPHQKEGVKVVSIAPLIPNGAPVIWRGPRRAKALEQFIGGVQWGALDFLIADLPPGTGDEVLTITQRTSPQLAIVVTTPQDISLMDSLRAANMAREMDVPRIGIVENMSGFVCPNCGSEYSLFGSGGGAKQAKELGLEFLGRIPIDIEIRRGGDEGRPIVLHSEDAPISQTFIDLAHRLESL